MVARSLRRLVSWWQRATGKTTRVRVYLKSGSQIELDTKKFEWKHDSAGNVSSLVWDVRGPVLLKSILIHEIEAIVLLD